MRTLLLVVASAWLIAGVVVGVVLGRIARYLGESENRP